MTLTRCDEGRTHGCLCVAFCGRHVDIVPADNSGVGVSNVEHGIGDRLVMEVKWAWRMVRHSCVKQRVSLHY